MEYELKAAKTVLTETDKDRLVCLFLTIEPSEVNGLVKWQEASDALGNASVDSLRVSTRNTLKKVKVGNVSAEVLNNEVPAAKAKATPKKRKSKGGEEQEGAETTTPKKRKSKAGEDQAEGGETTTPKKRGRKLKALAAAPIEDNNDDQAANETAIQEQIKREQEDESEEA